MQIKTVKLKSSGFAGAEVHYFIEEVKGNRKSHTLIKKYPKDPIHKDLENLFKDLREHILDIRELTHNMDEKDIMFTIHDTEVTGIEFDSDGFILHGYKNIFGNKKALLDTPKIEEIDNFHKYEEVMDIMRSIAIETKLYLDGEKKISDQELTERWIEAGKSKEMDMEKFKGLSAEEQRDFCTKLLETQFGSVVINQNEMDMENMDTNSVIEELETEFTINPGEEETIIPVAGKSKKTKKEAHSPNEAF